MQFLALFFLGFLQGLTEFLPVSSSGHLVLFSKIFNVQESLFVSIILHIATMLSVCVVLRKEIWQLITHPFSKQTILLAIATIPTCIFALIFLPIVKMAFAGALLPICFLISSCILLFASKKVQNGKEIDKKSAFLMGIAQGFATFPGISRSGSTISAGIFCGCDKEKTAKFSFLMSLPIIFLSLVMEIFEMASGQVSLSINPLAIILSFVTAFLVGIFAIKLMIKLTVKSNFKWFSVYLMILSVVCLFV